LIASVTRSANYKWWAFWAIAIGTFASVVDHGSVNIALPTIAQYFHTDLPSVQWVVIGFALTISALLLPLGRLSDLIGLKRVYLFGSVVFIIGAVLAGFAANLPMLIVARLVQGSGAAMTQGTGMAIIAGAFPASERGKAIGFSMSIVGVGAIAGPAVGGMLVDALGWRSVFLANIPLVGLGIATGLAFLDRGQETLTLTKPTESAQTRRGRFDWLGTALSTGALLTFLLAVTNGHRSGWDSPPIIGAMLAFGGLLGAFVWWELHYASPLLDLRLFKSRTFSFGISAAYLTFLGAASVLFLTPFYLQQVLDYSPRQAGLVVVPGAICMALLGQLSGRLSDRYGWRIFTVGGLACSAIGLLLFSRVTADSSLLLVLPALMLHSCGMGIFYSPNSSSVLSSVPREKYGVVSAFLNLVRNAGNVSSVAVATAIVTATMASMGYEPSLDAVRGGGAGVELAFTQGLRYAFLSLMGLVLAALAISALARNDPPAQPVEPQLSQRHSSR
jgi:EmrB/QacA subfamily drug resistance transporter